MVIEISESTTIIVWMMEWIAVVIFMYDSHVIVGSVTGSERMRRRSACPLVWQKLASASKGYPRYCTPICCLRRIHKIMNNYS
jgi:hypothetical protein